MIIVGTATAPPWVEKPPLKQRVPRRPRIAATWTSWTGESWTLTEGRSPVFVLQGATGLGMTDPQHRWSEAPTIDGGTWDGMRTGIGSVFLPVRIGMPSMSHDQFMEVHDAFMRSIRPDKYATYRITRPDGRWREIRCRYQSGGDAPIELDPVMTRRATYGLSFSTGDPYWRGETITPVFRSPTHTIARYPMRYPYRVRSWETLGFAEVTNPGDVAAFPVWKVNGPFTGFTIGVGSDTVSLALTKSAGQWVEVDMNPTRLTIYDEAGVDRWDNATSANFSSIPPGDLVSLTTIVTGTGATSSVEVSFTPRYRRAW